MAKITRPIMFSDHFSVDPAELSKLGILNPTLNVDTELFIDPLLLVDSSHPEMKLARSTYEQYFIRVASFLAKIQREDDVAWRTAFKLLSFPEVKGTCLGYGAASVAGSGAGPEAAKRLLQTGMEIMDLGVSDPDLFAAMALFEKSFGPDLISDMTTNIIFGELIALNQRVLPHLAVPLHHFNVRLANGSRYSFDAPRNPAFGKDTPVILIPMDVVRPLPVSTSWGDVAEAATENEILRADLSDDIAQMWRRKTLESKDQLKNWALNNKANFVMLLDMLHGHSAKPYDFLADPLGELIWRRIGGEAIDGVPLGIKPPDKYDTDSALSTVKRIIDRFEFIIDTRRLSEELYYNDKPRPEKAAQRIFFAIADAYCDANNLDLTPEADTGNGPVDFKVSKGKSSRILVEIKLSTNPAVVSGYEKQLMKYDEAEEALHSYYVILDVGKIGEKYDRVLALRNERVANKLRAPEIVLIDASRKPSASKLKM